MHYASVSMYNEQNTLWNVGKFRTRGFILVSGHFCSRNFAKHPHALMFESIYQQDMAQHSSELNEAVGEHWPVQDIWPPTCIK